MAKPCNGATTTRPIDPGAVGAPESSGYPRPAPPRFARGNASRSGIAARSKPTSSALHAPSPPMRPRRPGTRPARPATPSRRTSAPPATRSVEPRCPGSGGPTPPGSMASSAGCRGRSATASSPAAAGRPHVQPERRPGGKNAGNRRPPFRERHPVRRRRHMARILAYDRQPAGPGSQPNHNISRNTNPCQKNCATSVFRAGQRHPARSGCGADRATFPWDGGSAVRMQRRARRLSLGTRAHRQERRHAAPIQLTVRRQTGIRPACRARTAPWRRCATPTRAIWRNCCANKTSAGQRSLRSNCHCPGQQVGAGRIANSRKI